MSALHFTIIDFADASLNKTSVLVTGERDAIVIDAAFTRADGHRIVAAVLDSGKTLRTVAITAGDPDFYFGAEVIQDAFPDARFVAPADVIEHIAHSYEKKLGAWAHLGPNLPTRLVDIDVLDGDLTLESHTLELRKADALGDRGWYFFEPETRSVVGGVLLFDGLHVWTADSATSDSRAAWLEALDSLDALDPQFVAAGHRAPGAPTDATAIAHTRAYLQLFEQIVADSSSAESAEKALLAAYPEAGLTIAAGLGTKVAKGEMTWG
ncbi:MBL fold metallo-hydrolase [Agromyces atrinae]|uniref:MBL fold metallo-hydrolase n=1 Tax=Agromyces atrinae TaxID=592376 RepID=UPI001F5991FE|nr:MBL fold metallo-hydrolase [Agromyces atrinae]MCI2957532.1 MBL fold metallo-hydrolase [Agromyces atrinae]